MQSLAALALELLLLSLVVVGPVGVGGEGEGPAGESDDGGDAGVLEALREDLGADEAGTAC